MPSAVLNGVRIEYREFGSGFPLVFAHELAGSMESWAPQVSHFARRYRVITYNARGYPPSDVPDSWEDYSQEQQVEDLYLLLQHLGIQSAFVGGLSMGGHTTVAFGLAHPELARGLIIAGTGSGSADPVEFAAGAERYAARLLAGGMSDMEGYMTGPTRSRFAQKDPLGHRAYTDAFLGHSALGKANTLRGFQARRPTLYSRESELAQLRVPSLIVVGDEDDPCLEPSLFLKRTIPASGLVVLPQTGHAVNVEEPALFNQVVGEFLAQVEAGRWLDRDAGTGESIG